MEEINILRCELIGSEPEGLRDELDEEQGVCVCDHTFECFC